MSFLKLYGYKRFDNNFRFSPYVDGRPLADEKLEFNWIYFDESLIFIELSSEQLS